MQEPWFQDKGIAIRFKQDFVQIAESELGPAKLPFRLPYSIGILSGYAFDILSRISGRKFTVRIKKFCSNTTDPSLALEETGFKPPTPLREGLRLMIAAMRADKSKNTSPNS